MKNLLVIIVLAFAFIGCDKPILQDYYFQMKNFDESKTYVFVDQNNSKNILNIKMYYKLIDSDTIFFSETLNSNGKPNEVFKERVGKSQSIMTDYYFVDYDLQGNALNKNSDITYTDVYSYVPKSYPLTWKVKIGLNKSYLFYPVPPTIILSIFNVG